MQKESATGLRSARRLGKICADAGHPRPPSFSARRGRRVCDDALEPEQRDALDPADDLSPEKLFDRRWAATLFERAMEQLASESTAGGKERQFALLQPFLTADPGNGAYAAPAVELGTTPGALAVAVHRMRARWRDLVRAEVAETVGSAADVEDELRNLFG